jgi:hypothetical protein
MWTSRHDTWYANEGWFALSLLLQANEQAVPTSRQHDTWYALFLLLQDVRYLCRRRMISRCKQTIQQGDFLRFKSLLAKPHDQQPCNLAATRKIPMQIGRSTYLIRSTRHLAARPNNRERTATTYNSSQSERNLRSQRQIWHTRPRIRSP